MSGHLRPASGFERRFTAGDCFEISGLRFRVRAGRKAPGDLVLDWHTRTGFVPIEMQAAGLLADFFYENEHVLYPPSAGFEGGERVASFLRQSMRLGWDKMATDLRLEKLLAHRRPRFEQIELGFGE